MPPLPRQLALAAALAALPALAWADGQNERMHRASPPPSRSGGTSGGTSDGDTSGADWGSACNCLCSLTDVFFNAGSCASGAGTSAAQQLVTDGQGPYAVPPEPREPLRAYVLVGIERVVDARLLIVPRMEGAIDLPFNRRHALRIGLEHESFLESVHDAPTGRGRWDHIPLSTLRAGWILRPGDWELGVLGGLKLLDLGHGFEPGVDLGGVLRATFGRLSVEAGVLGLLFEPVTGVEPWVRVAWAFGPLQAGLGWKHTQFFDALGPIRYTGPEVSVALRP